VTPAETFACYAVLDDNRPGVSRDVISSHLAQSLQPVTNY